MSLVVTCPSCGTVFTMVREQLEASEGRVRCGHCMEVFDAQAQLTELGERRYEPTRALGNTEHANNIDSSHMPAALPTPEDDLSFVRLAKRDQLWRHPLIRVLLITLAVALLGLLGVQWAHSERERFVQLFPHQAGWMKKLCDVWSCTPPVRRQINGWLIENSSFQKEGTQAFRLSATLKNTAANTLLIPHIELSLLDSSEALLVRYVIAPDQTAASPTEVRLPAGAERSSSWLITPQTSKAQLNTKDIVGYRLVLFYP